MRRRETFMQMISFPSATGETTRKFLRDAYRFTPGTGWRRIPDVPRSIVAAASPAFSLGREELILLGGDDGSNFGRDFVSADRHPGFSQQVWSYRPATQTWTALEPLPAADSFRGKFSSPVTTGTTAWRGRVVIPSGEIRPTIRTPDVLTVELDPLSRRD